MKGDVLLIVNFLICDSKSHSLFLVLQIFNPVHTTIFTKINGVNTSLIYGFSHKICHSFVLKDDKKVAKSNGHIWMLVKSNISAT